MKTLARLSVRLIPALAILPLQATQAATILSDSFDNGTMARPFNSQLDGAAVETGTGSWDALGNVRFNVFNGERNIYANSTNPQRATLGFSYNPGEVVTMTWTVSRDQADWLGAGFNDGTGASPILTNGQFWMTFDGSQIVAFENGNSTTIGTYDAGTDFNLVGGDYQTLSLTYDTGANTITGSANGTTLFSNRTPGFTPSVDAIVFRWQNPDSSNGDSFGDVEVTAIPEPGAIGLAAALSALIVVFRLKRRA